jgi:RHS repeat-associated protein
VVCLAVVTTFAPSVAQASVPARTPKVAPAKVAERPDRVSAMVTARVQKSRVEDLSSRTPTTATYANPDGTWTTESYAGVVRSKSDGDTWVPVDSSLQSAHGKFEPKATPFDAAYSTGGDKTVGSVTAPDGATVKVGWPSALPAPQIKGDELTYQGIAPDADLVVGSHADGFDYSMVLTKAPAAGAAPVEYRFPLRFGGGKPEVKPDGSIVVMDGKRPVATLTAPVMWDSSTSTNDAGQTVQPGQADRRPVAASVEGTGDSRTLVLRPDMSFLQDPKTVYPVTVDPTVILGVAGDTWVNSLSPNTSQYSSPELQVGSNNLGLTKSRSFMYFDWNPLYTMPPGVLTSAQLQLTDFATGACAGTAVRVSRITGNWTEGGLTWGNQPTVTSAGSATSTGSFGASACPGEGIVSFDMTAIVNDWINGAWNVGVRVSADNESAASGYRKFRSVENGDASKAPKLVFTYNAYPSTPTGLTISPGYNGYASSTTPTLSAVVSDPDSGPVRGYFEIKSGSTVVWSGSSPMATSGDRVSVTVPSGVLADGTTYTVNAYSQDSSLNSQAAASKSMPVDVTAPTVAISSTGYTNGGWQTAPPSSTTVTLQGSSDTGGFYASYDGVPVATVPADSTGKFVSSAFSPTPGWHTWTITPVDRAGNQGAPTDFSFGVGGGGFITPSTWTETTSSFPVQMTAPPNSTGATLQWQVYGETTWHTATQLTSGGSAWSGSVTTTNGHSATPALVWNATGEPFGSGTLTAPKLVVIKGCFHYASAADSCTATNPIILTTSARGGNFPEAKLGPASVALYTGEATISDTDAADSKAGIGRTFSSFSDATLTPGVFGPGWSEPSVLTAPSADAKAQVVDNRTKDGTFAIVDPDSGSQVFSPKSGSTTDYVPVHPTGDATALTFTAGTNGDPDKLVLLRPLGSGSVTTTWTLKPSDTGGSPEWTVDQVNAPGTTSDTSVTSAAGSQRPVWIRESDPGVAATCTASIQTTGCRGLQISYTGTGSATRVSSVSRVIGADTQAGVVTKTLATYTYDGSGQLSSVCSAAPAAGKPALCVGYTYTTVAGRTLLAQITPPGLKPWRFTYDSIARLTTVKREKPTGGDAVWSADYNLSVTASGLPDLTSATAAQWGQTVVPSKVFAVYEPFTGTAGLTHAHLFYTTTNGTVTNTANYGPAGWLVDTSWYDARGNVVRQLDSTGWARVQAAAAGDRPRIAGEASSYTVYNTWGDASTVGTRVVDEYGPAHTATLRNGTVGLYRTHTHTMYDDSPDVDTSLIADRPGSTGLGLRVEQVDGVTDAAMSAQDSDAVVTKYGYGPVVAGDGNGWTLGRATRVTSQLGTGTTTAITRFDDSGRMIESRQPGASEDSSHQGNDAHSSDTTYYTASGSGDCGGKPAWEGLVCKVGPAAQPGGTSAPVTYTSSYNDALQPVTVQDVSGGTTARTTTTTYDNIGRVVGVAKVTSGSGVANESISTAYGYDDTTGLATTTTNPTTGKAVTAGYDSWGRVTSYTDELATVSTTTYDDAGNIATSNDGSATFAYSYDGQGRVSSVDTGGGVGTFRYAYTSAGELESVTYPNGVSARTSYDQAGYQTGLSYSQGSTELLGFTATVDAAGRTVAESSPMSAQQYTFDDLGRLTGTAASTQRGCVTRTYGYDASWNRSSSSSYGPDSAGQCQTATPTIARSTSYDSADRDTNAGYTYDGLGRTLTVPQADTTANASGTLTATYHADDMVASLSQAVASGTGTEVDATSYRLDPTERIDSIINTTNGTETNRYRYRFADGSDSPVAIDSSTDGGVAWTTTRYVAVPGVGMVASSTGGTATIHLVNIHGDIVATMPDATGAATVNSYAESDEFGNTPSDAAPTRYGWLGSASRSHDAVGGMVLMGSRVYNPTTGAFLQADPVLHGGLTTYGYPNDPVNLADINGQYWGQRFVKKVIKAAEFIVNWALIDLVEGAVGRVVADAVFAAACDGMVMLCRAATAGVIAFVGTLVIAVAKGKKPSLSNAAWDGVIAFLREFSGGMSARRLRTVGSIFKRGYIAFANFLDDYGHPTIANYVLTLGQMVVDDLYEVFTG